MKTKEAQNAYTREHYRLNTQAYKDRNKRNKEKIRQYLKEIKSNTPCKDCGKFYPHYVMDFDHLRDKKFTIARMTSESLKRVKEEISKCEIVCSNCHRERTHNPSVV